VVRYLVKTSFKTKKQVVDAVFEHIVTGGERFFGGSRPWFSGSAAVVSPSGPGGLVAAFGTVHFTESYPPCLTLLPEW
jgi:hypothetical protein